ncbi:MAG: VWA domain-containing protein [Fimbriimonas sp.]
MEVTLTAHKDERACLLMASFTASEDATQQTSPATVCVVIDRSGSMSGRKLEITKQAVAKLIRSLSPADRLALVTYDDQVDLVSGLVAPTEALARRVEAIDSGGSTDLYGGWLMGAKVVGRGGRVILLSDGQANAGLYTQAEELRLHASRSYEAFGVTTTTIGVGSDYDEALMAGMARAGGGSHYFAHTAEAIDDAFSRERFNIGAVALERVSIRYQGRTVQVGHLWAGETKHIVMDANDLQGEPATVRYGLRSTGQRATHALLMPSEFGHSDDVTLEALIEKAARIEEEASSVRNPETAKELGLKVREVTLLLLAHPLADSELASAVVARLEQARERLVALERHYDAHEASMHRKRSMQSSMNVRDRAKSYSSFDEDRVSESAFLRSAMSSDDDLLESPASSVFLKARPEDWKRWKAFPASSGPNRILLLMVDPKDGFTISEIQKAVKQPVRPAMRPYTEAEVFDRIDRA